MECPIWGSLVYYADYDVLAFASLLRTGIYVPAYYHATQAIEKYLKALVLSTTDPAGKTHPYPKHKGWLHDHNLARLARRCTNQPYYCGPEVQETLSRFSEFDQKSRYPWVSQKLASGFSGEDVPIINDLLVRLRIDLPLAVDDYPLGISIRGHHHGHPELVANPFWAQIEAPAIAAAREMIPQIERMVRW